jgi:hypothetical protein
LWTVAALRARRQREGAGRAVVRRWADLARADSPAAKGRQPRAARARDLLRGARRLRTVVARDARARRLHGAIEAVQACKKARNKVEGRTQQFKSSDAECIGAHRQGKECTRQGQSRSRNTQDRTALSGRRKKKTQIGANHDMLEQSHDAPESALGSLEGSTTPRGRRSRRGQEG